MKKIKTFNELNSQTKNESLVLLPAALGLVVWYGLMYGYVKVKTLIDFVTFKNALSKIEPIFDKIKDDAQMLDLLKQLDNHKDGLYFGEEEGENPRRTKAFQIIEQIYDRASEILDAKEFELFKSSAKNVDYGSGKPAAYFTKEDPKFTHWDRTV